MSEDTHPLSPTPIPAAREPHKTSLSLSRTPTASHPASASSSPDRPPAPFLSTSQGDGYVEDSQDEDLENGGRESAEETDGAGERSPMLEQWEGDEEDDEAADEDSLNFALYSDPGGSGDFGRSGPGVRRSGSHPHLTKGQKRRVYGGGRNSDSIEGGGMGVGEVAGLIFAGLVGPTPIFMPHVAALLGLPLYLPLLFLTATLSCFAFVALGVETRYVGSRSWPSLASAVFPHRFKIHRLGEALAAIMVFLASLARGIVGVVAASEISGDLMMPTEKAGLKERLVGCGTIAILWVVFPSILLPLFRTFIKRRPTSPQGFNNPSSQSRLPIYISFFLWPTALLIMGIRLRTLNLSKSAPDVMLLQLDTRPSEREAMGLSIWGGVALLVFSLSSHHETFTYLSSLARPPSTSTSSRLLGRNKSPNTPRGPKSEKEGKRNQWPLAAVLGVFSATILQMGWGLVGYLGIDGGGREGNLFASHILHRDDGWLKIVRSMVLVAILSGLEPSLQGAFGRIILAFSPRRKKEEDGGTYKRVGKGDQEKRTGGWSWRNELARLLVWGCVAGAAMGVSTIGENGEGLVSVAEVVGCIISSWLTFLAPSLFFIVLFHLRRPRSIFISDPNSPAFDTLLMRKEREVQRRLSGRRIWQDVLIFGGLLPFGLVTFLRGILALVAREYY